MTSAPGWVCDQEDGTFDHDWQFVSDWGGDPDVIGGTFDCSFKRCRVCGEEAPIEVGDDFDPEPAHESYRDEP